jgi:diaminopimelate epimerase
MKLSKYSGAGNTFVILENEIPLPETIRTLCSKYDTDGLIVVKQFSMRYFNCDGYEASMCGNGLRCVIKYLWDTGIRQKIYSITTKAGVQQGTIEGDHVACLLQPPTQIKWDQKISIDTKELSFHFINTSVPHVVVFDEFDLEQAVKIRTHEHFAPQGANVNFISTLSGNEITLRTYERGVEKETLACGTGAVASALAAAKKYSLYSPIQVRVRSNETLEVGFSLKNDLFADITLKGSATCVIVAGD